MIYGLYFLLLAGVLLTLNLRTYRSAAVKRITYYGMWIAIIASVASVVTERMS